MLMNRWSRLCAVCSRVVDSSRGGWGTLQTSLKHASMAQVQHWGTAAPKRLCHSDLGDLYKKESVQRHLQQLMEEYRDLGKKLQHAHLSESDRKVLIKRHTGLLPLANVFKSIEQALKDLEEVLSLLHSEYFILFRSNNFLPFFFIVSEHSPFINKSPKFSPLTGRFGWCQRRRRAIDPAAERGGSTHFRQDRGLKEGCKNTKRPDKTCRNTVCVSFDVNECTVSRSSWSELLFPLTLLTPAMFCWRSCQDEQQEVTKGGRQCLTGTHGVFSYYLFVWLQVTSASSSPEKCLTCTRALRLTRTGTLGF